MHKFINSYLIGIITIVCLHFLLDGNDVCGQDYNTYLQAKKYFENQEYNESLKLLDIYLQKYQDSVEAYILRGDVNLLLKNFQQSISDYENVILKDNLDYRGFYGQALVYMAINEFNIALTKMTRACELKQQNPKLMTSLAIIYFTLGNRDTAFIIIDNTIQIDSTYSEAYDNKAKFYFYSEDISKAVNEL